MKRLRAVLCALAIACALSTTLHAAWGLRAGTPIAGLTCNTGTTCNIGTPGTTPTSGDRMILLFACSTIDSAGQCAVSTGVADGATHTWTLDAKRQKHYGVSYYAGCEVWSAVANGASPTNITVTFTPNITAAGGVALAFAAFSGVDTTTGAGGALDGSVQWADGTGAASPADSGAGGTTSAANELLISAFCDPGNNRTLTAGTGFTSASKKDATGTEETMLAYKDSGSSGSTIQATTAFSGAATDWQQGALVYKITGGAAPSCPKTLTLLGVGC